MPKEYDPSIGNKFIFVTGGVMSGLGKGITAASTGRLLVDAGFNVTAIKVDPYLNIDAGTMNPYEHGEVYVLKDGGEVDLDLGNYERFLGIDMTSDHNITTGKTYQSVINAERSGDYLGKTVQIIPHITNHIKRQIREVAEGSDVCIVEIGGTVGDIESMPFLESLRQLATEEDKNDLLFMHVTLVPETVKGNQKTKPTQHSVKELRSIGLNPDIVVGRSESHLEPKTKTKIARFCDVPNEAVFSNPDVDDIYEVPLVVEEEGLDSFVMNKLGIKEKATNKAEQSHQWKNLVTQDQSGNVKIAIAGKYDLEDAYMSIHEALKHAGIEHNTNVETLWVDTEEMDQRHKERLENSDGIIIPGGFGSRGVEGKIETVRYARENDIPFLGLCLGFQIAVIEYARNVLGLENANSTEIDDKTPHPVIDILPEQREIDEKGGTMRLGAYETAIESGTLAESVYESASCTGRHRHRYEVNPAYIDELESGEMQFSGESGKRMEILEMNNHPFFFGTQFHPEFRSRPDRPSPPFVSLIKASSMNEEDELDGYNDISIGSVGGGRSYSGL